MGTQRKLTRCKDFGISTQMASDDVSVTIGPTSYTPRYASPETLSFESRGRASDIFSMGCVWVEIYTVIIGERLDTLHEELGFMTSNSDDSGSESSEEYSNIHEKSRHDYGPGAPYAKGGVLYMIP
jgi:serine/threonine protein kinase